MPVIGGIHGLFSSFKDKKFNPGVFSGIPKVFQGDVSLLGVLLISPVSIGLGVDIDTQLLALINFEVPISSLRSSSFSIIVYTEINSATSPDVDALINPSVFWISIPIKIAAPHLVTIGGALYTKVVKSSFIISMISLVRPFFSLIAVITCLNNATVLPV